MNNVDLLLVHDYYFIFYRYKNKHHGSWFKRNHEFISDK